MKDLGIINIDGRKICYSGIGKMFYESGFPISIAISSLTDKGIEVCLLGVADELLKNGWSAKTVISKFEEELMDTNMPKEDIIAIYGFCKADYETQREFIFQSRFGTRDAAKKWLNQQLLKDAED